MPEVCIKLFIKPQTFKVKSLFFFPLKFIHSENLISA